MPLAEAETSESIDAITPTEDLPVTVYSPESPLANPGKLVREIFSDLWRSRELISILFMRDLKAQFRQSYLGYIWLIAPPLMTTGVWLFLNRSNIINISDSGMPYPVFVLIGTVFWQAFANGIEAPLKAFNAGKPVFMKLKVPPEAFIAAGSARTVFDFLISLALLVPIFLFYGVTPPLTVLLLPIVILASYLMSAALGLLLVPIGGLYTDVQQASSMVLRFAMFFAPVVYPVPSEGMLGFLMKWNPATSIIQCARDSLVLGTGQGWLGLVMWMPIMAACLIFGLIVIRVVMPHLVARMGM